MSPKLDAAKQVMGEALRKATRSLSPMEYAEYLDWLVLETGALGMNDPKRDHGPQYTGTLADACQFCLGQKGGTPGNENIVGGVTACDDCTVLIHRVMDADDNRLRTPGK